MVRFDIARIFVEAVRKPKELWTPQEKKAYSIIAGREMTPEQRRDQTISFVYGNLATDGTCVSRERLGEIYDRLHSN